MTREVKVMTPSNPEQSTLLIILGASQFPHSSYSGSPAFKRAADAAIGYFLAVDGYHLNPSNFCWLFDSDLEPVAMLNHMSTFIQSRKADLEKTGIIPTDIIFYYIGHGAFDKNDHYCLILKNTTQSFLTSSSIPISSLSELILTKAQWMRSIVILDACFSAAAVARFQSNAFDAVKRNLNTAQLPKKGISILASSSKDRVSMLTEDEDCTMFSKALIATLKSGSEKYSKERLSLKEVHSLLKQKMNEWYENSTIPPEVHSPKQPEGEIADVLLFPNPAEIQLQEVTKEQKKRKSEQEATRLLAEEAKRIQMQEGERERKLKEAQEQHTVRELQIRKEAEERNAQRLLKDSNFKESYTLEAESTDNRELNQTFLDQWIQDKLKEILIKKLTIKEDIEKIKDRVQELPNYIYHTKDYMRSEKRKGVHFHIKTYKEDIRKYKWELKEKSLKLYHLEKEYFILEGQEEVFKNLLTNKLRAEVLGELKQKRQQGQTISFSEIVFNHLNEEKKRRNVSFRLSPDLDPKWLFLFKVILTGFAILAFLIYVFIFYIPWMNTLYDDFFTASILNKINALCCILVLLIGCYIQIPPIIKTYFPLYKKPEGSVRRFVLILTLLMQLSFPCWFIISLVSFIPWTWKLLNNSNDLLLNKNGKNATWLALVIIFTFYISIVSSIWKNIKKTNESKSN